MSWSCKKCGGEHPDSLKVCHGNSNNSQQLSRSYSREERSRMCQNCGSIIPLTWDNCDCQNHWEDFAPR